MNLNRLFYGVARVAMIIAAVACIPTEIRAAVPSLDELLPLDNPHVKAVITIQTEVTPTVMSWPGVIGTAVGLDELGQPALVIYVDRDAASMADVIHAIPAQYRGSNVRVEITDKFLAFAAHTGKQSPPILMGTSGGWNFDLANGYCCGGTLGSLVQVNGVQYILSNYHVLESDIVYGGNGLVAKSADPIIQPGLIDVGCYAPNSQIVGTLVKLGALPNSNVDASVAQVSPGMVSPNGAILEIGTISTNIVKASLRMAVKKSGRTTGLTTSKVSGLNATVSIRYENECAGGTAFTKTFTGQVVISNSGSRFLNAGDSGSLMVENMTSKPRAIGLLFAGSSTSAIANPIDQVLQFIGSKLGGTASMVGN